MPIYGFECEQCGHQFDRLQKLSDPDPTVCPACQAEGVRRQVTAPAFRLAGSGWYETDFKKDGDKKRNLAGDGDASSKPAEAGKGESKSDGGKTETAATAKPAATESKPPSPTPAS